MASEILVKTRTVIEAQANTTALTAGADPNNGGGTYTGATPVVIDNRLTGGSDNSKGAHFLNLELNVTTHSGGDATAEIWYCTSKDASNYTKWRYSHTVGETILSAATPRCDAGIFELSALCYKLVVVARTVAFTATLSATPVLYEGQ